MFYCLDLLCRLKLDEALHDWDKVMTNFAKVTIYNERLSVTRVEEVEAYSLLQLFSDIGTNSSFKGWK